MKTVSGKVTSTKPISLSKAAKVLSNFVAAETGASQAVSAYLRRASASVNELVQFHKELRASNSDRKHRKHVEESVNSEGQVKYGQNPEKDAVGQNIEDGVRSDADKKMHRKNKHSEDVEKGGDSLMVGKRIGKNWKKRKTEEVLNGEAVDFLEQSSSKKKRRKIEHDQ